MEKHTPGPWWFSKNDNAILTDPMGNIKPAKIHYTGNVEETEANGSLIAAAPEILDALEELLLWHQNTMENNGGLSHILKAKLTIKKAKGEQ